jgi:diacylglycerol kinase family enzyme
MPSSTTSSICPSDLHVFLAHVRLKSVPQGSSAAPTFLLKLDSKTHLLTLFNAKEVAIFTIPLARIINLTGNYEGSSAPSFQSALVKKHSSGSTRHEDPNGAANTGLLPGSPAVTKSTNAAVSDLLSQAFSISFLPIGATEFQQARLLTVYPSEPGSFSQLSTLLRMVDREVYAHGPRRVIAFVSPISGKGKGVELWARYGASFIGASRHSLTTIHTTHRYHAREYCRDLLNEIRSTDILVAVGGDGMLWELLNGLKQRAKLLTRAGSETHAEQGSSRNGDGEVRNVPLSSPDRDSTPPFVFPSVAVFPTGSGCAMATALSVLDFSVAALSIIHAVTIPMETMILWQLETEVEGKANVVSEQSSAPPQANVIRATEEDPSWSFLSLATCFIAELDRHSEKWRWMGNTRFAAYAVQRLVRGVPKYGATVRYVPWKPLTRAIAWGPTGDQRPNGQPKEFRCTWSKTCRCVQYEHVDIDKEPEEATPPPLAERGTAVTPPPDGDEWIEIPVKEFSLLTLCRCAFLARDNICAPYAHLLDGAIDITFVAGNVSRIDLAKILLEMETGKHVTNPLFHYIKAKKVQIFPHEGEVMFDGESAEFHGYHCEVDPRPVHLVRTAVPYGHRWEDLTEEEWRQTVSPPRRRHHYEKKRPAPLGLSKQLSYLQ